MAAWNSTLQKPQLGARMIQVTVWNKYIPKTEHCLIHANLLCTSGHFLDIFKDLACLGAEDIPQLDFRWGRRPLFNIYLHWLYHRELLTVSELVVRNGRSDTRSKHVIAQGDLSDLLLCWILAIELRDDRFKDFVTSAIIKRLREDQHRAVFMHCLTAEILKDIYNVTGKESPVRALLVDSIVRFATPSQLESFSVRYPHEFILAIMVRYAQEVEKIRTRGGTAPHVGAHTQSSKVGGISRVYYDFDGQIDGQEEEKVPVKVNEVSLDEGS